MGYQYKIGGLHMAVIDHITTNNSATYEVQDTVARTKANNLESANYTDIGGGVRRWQYFPSQN